MFNVVRRSQIVGLTVINGSSATQYARVESVWLNRDGRVVYLASSEGYIPLEQVSVVGEDAVVTYSNKLVESPEDSLRIDRIEVSSPTSAPYGWVEDFIFDWKSGDVVAYVLNGTVAEPFGGSAVFYADEVKMIDNELIIVKDGARNRLINEAEGLEGFISEKPQQVRHLVKKMCDRLYDSIIVDDNVETVRFKIQQVSDKLASSEGINSKALAEATEFLQDKWRELQHIANSNSNHKQMNQQLVRLSHS